MGHFQRIFDADAEKKAFDLNHRKTISFNIGKYDENVARGKEQYANIELAKKRAAHQKYKIINNFENYLKEFELNFTSRGGKIIWAQDSSEAICEILKLLQKNDIKKVVKSKSMITEELELNEHLQKHDIEAVETDLGEFIVQIAGEKPYHIITPVMHKSKEEIAEIFHEKYNISRDSSPEEITLFVRSLLRSKFINAGAGITGANFLIADTGAICLTENEGNIVMSVSWPRIHIAIAGYDKLIPSIKDLQTFWPLLSTHGTGQNITAYNTIITGPRQEGETDGPEELYLVIVDNGRSELLAQVEQRKAMTCIRCGACLNACPVYRTIGGHSYGTVYSGPIGAVITPYLRGLSDYKHLSYASSLCGRCTEVCPMKIELHRLLLYNRKDVVQKGLNHRNEKILMWGWKKIMTNRWLMDKTGARSKNTALKLFLRKNWGNHKELPEIKSKSFNKMWKEWKGEV